MTFVIDISSSSSSLGAVDASLPEAVLTAVTAVGQLNSTPPIVEKAADGIATVDDGIGNATSNSAAWSPLLEKLEIFSNLVDKFADVMLLSRCHLIPMRH